MAPPRHRLASSERGFTLVELLVVVLIVAVLAAIAIPTFLDQRGKSQDAEAKWMAAVTAQALHVWHQERDTFAGADVDGLTRIEPTVREIRGLSFSDLGEDSFTISVDSAAGESGGGPFVIEYRAGDTNRTCAVPNRGSCPDGGTW